MGRYNPLLGKQGGDYMLPNEAIGFKYNLVQGRINKIVSVNKLCELNNTTRKTLSKWVKRYINKGIEGLNELSRSPKHIWNKTPKWVQQTICNLYSCSIDPEEIFLSLKQLYPVCLSTVYNILHRYNVFGKAKYKPAIQRFQYKQPNDLWHIDITKFTIKGEGRFYIIAIIDNFSRKIIAIGVFNRQTAENVVAVFKEAVSMHGKPKAILSDNGKQFTGKLFQQFCETNGINHRRTRPYNPKCNGKIERWFKTLKKELRLYWFESVEQFEQTVNRFVDGYNNKPKWVLNWKTPNQMHC